MTSKCASISVKGQGIYLCLPRPGVNRESRGAGENCFSSGEQSRELVHRDATIAGINTQATELYGCIVVVG